MNRFCFPGVGRPLDLNATSDSCAWARVVNAGRRQNSGGHLSFALGSAGRSHASSSAAVSTTRKWARARGVMEHSDSARWIPLLITVRRRQQIWMIWIARARPVIDRPRPRDLSRSIALLGIASPISASLAVRGRQREAVVAGVTGHRRAGKLDFVYRIRRRASRPSRRWKADSAECAVDPRVSGLCGVWSCATEVRPSAMRLDWRAVDARVE